MSKIPEKEEADYRACMLGLRDYVNKNGFKNVVLGLSGGINSAICAALAVDALGEERRARRHDALSLHVEGFARRTPRTAPARSAAATTSCRSSSRSRASRMR